ncbi:MAG: MFS transporter, partial [Slackia sp.]
MAPSIATWLVKPQPRLGAGGLLVLLVAASLITPLSLDMYTPAVPGMAAYFDTGVSLVNLTLVGYYAFFALGMLVFGPLSDKHGRRPVLLAGVGLYSLSSAACALSPTIEFLIAARIAQALGAGAISAVCTAAVKDSFQAYYREKILSVIQVLFV